jgi:hypothetical protein
MENYVVKMESKPVIGKICFTIFLISFLVLPAVFAQDDVESTAFTPQDQFLIPEYNSAISFAAGGSYSNASLVDNIWHFTGLLLTNATSIFPFFNGIRFSVSAQNCNLTITQIDTLNVFPPSSGWIEYTVSGVGSQSLNLDYQEGWLSYKVYIDGEEKAQNDGWAVTKDGWITVTGATSNVRIHYGRASEAFTPADTFDIPECNSSINFTFDGSYVYTNFDNIIWRFQNLIADDYDRPNRPTWYLSMSARNCNLTITSYCPPQVFNGVDGLINYTVTGVGTQTLDNNYDRVGGWPINYTVIIDGTERAQNDSWAVTDDGWLTVTGATSNVTIIYKEIIPDWIKNAPPPGEPEPKESIGIFAGNNTILYVIMTAIAIVAVAALAVLMFKRRDKQKPNNPSLGAKNN